MNYIPGFSNYLETSVPRYAVGGEVMGGATTAPEAAPDYNSDFLKTLRDAGMSEADIANLSNFTGIDDSLYGMNFGSNFGGGPMGGIYPDDPNLQYIGAPTSNKGKATSQTGGNTFTMTPDQKVRLVDHRTNQVIFEGTGYDAARKATELGQGLTDEFGRKANYSIQTADPTGSYSTVAYEKKNKSTLGEIANVAGTVLPLAMIPLTMGMSAPLAGISTAGKIALGAGLGGLGSGLKGDDILKGAAMGGLSAAGGSLLGAPLGKVGDIGLRAGTAIGTGLGSTAGGLLTGQSLEDALIGGVVSGGLSYITPDIVEGLGINQGPSTSASTGSDVNADLVPNALKGLNFGPLDSVSIPAGVGGVSIPAGVGGGIINVTGSVPSSVPSSVPVPVTGGLSPDVQAGIAEFAKNPIVAEGSKIEPATPVSVPVTGGLSPDVQAGIAEFEKNPIVAEGSKIEPAAPVSVPVTGAAPLDPIYGDIVVNAVTKEEGLPEGSVVAGLPITGLPTADPALTGEDGKKLGVKDYFEIASLLAGLIPGGGKGGDGQTGTYTPGGRGLNPIFSAQLPAAGGLGTIGANRTARPLGDVDWLTYGERPELNFFNYSTPTTPAPITSPIPNEPAGPSMYAPDVDDMRFARGGATPARRGGSSDRTEFAVNGPGTGRSDDIPAVLSDGEYVIDAETVALLGDGSSKAGAKKLDDLRVKIRKHKGKKLAKGRFSANAKKPEAYLSGGRI